MSNYKSSPKFEQVGNIIFLPRPRDVDTANADSTTDSEKFTHCPRGRQVNKNISGKGVNTNGESFTVPDLSMKELKVRFPSEWNSFRAMKYRRCGKNGKYICHPDIATFPNFLAAFGPKSDPSYTLDRLDPNDLVYAPGKCEWAPKQRQAENKTNTKYLTTSDGTCLHVSEWSRRSGIPSKTIHRRINELDWSVDDAVGIRVGGRRSASKSDNAGPYNQPDSPRKPLIPTGPPADLFHIVNVWADGLKQHHDCPFFVYEQKHMSYFRYFIEYCRKADVCEHKALASVVKGWRNFVHYNEYSQYTSRHKLPPERPDLKYLKYRMLDAVMYYRNNGGKCLSAELPDLRGVPVSTVTVVEPTEGEPHSTFRVIDPTE